MKRLHLKLYLLISLILFSDLSVSHPGHGDGVFDGTIHSNTYFIILSVLIFAGLLALRLLRR